MLNLLIFVLTAASALVVYFIFSFRDNHHGIAEKDLLDIKARLEQEKKHIECSLRPFEEKIDRLKAIDADSIDILIKSQQQLNDKFESLRREFMAGIKTRSDGKAVVNVTGKITNTRNSMVHIFHRLKLLLDKNSDEIRQLRLQALGFSTGITATSRSAEKLENNLKDISGGKKQRIGELLVDKGLVTVNMLNEAIDCQLRYGGGITQYLVAFGYISEDDLAKCISEQFKVPYLSPSMYRVSYDIISLMPVDIVRRYCLIPVDRRGDVLNVIMADPLDANAIKKIQEATDCTVCPYIGLISEIMEAIEEYYHIALDENKILAGSLVPAVVKSEKYTGLEHRKAMRFHVAVNINLPIGGKHLHTQTVDISATGMLFYVDCNIDVGAYVNVQVDFPEQLKAKPLGVICCVARVVDIGSGKLAVGVNFAKIDRDDLEVLMRYVRNLQKGKVSLE